MVDSERGLYLAAKRITELQSQIVDLVAACEAAKKEIVPVCEPGGCLLCDDWRKWVAQAEAALRKAKGES